MSSNKRTSSVTLLFKLSVQASEASDIPSQSEVGEEEQSMADDSVVGASIDDSAASDKEIAAANGDSEESDFSDEFSVKNTEEQLLMRIK